MEGTVKMQAPDKESVRLLVFDLLDPNTYEYPDKVCQLAATTLTALSERVEELSATWRQNVSLVERDAKNQVELKTLRAQREAALRLLAEHEESHAKLLCDGTCVASWCDKIRAALGATKSAALGAEEAK